MHRREMKKFAKQAKEKGLTLIPLKMYFTEGRAKVLIGLCKGRKLHDKREVLKKQSAQRDIRNAMHAVDLPNLKSQISNLKSKRHRHSPIVKQQTDERLRILHLAGLYKSHRLRPRHHQRFNLFARLSAVLPAFNPVAKNKCIRSFKMPGDM